MVNRICIALLALVTVAACTVSDSQYAASGATGLGGPTTTTSAGDMAGLEFDDYVEAAFRLLVSRSPQTVTEFGLGGEYALRDDRLDDLSQDYADETHRLQLEVLDRLEGFADADLDDSQQVTRDSFVWWLETRISLYPYRLQDWPVHFLLTSYNQGVIGFFYEVHPITNRNQADDYITRINAIADQTAQVVENMRAAAAIGVLPPTYVVDATIEQLRGDLGGGDPRHTAIFSSFADRVGRLGLNNATVNDYFQRAETAITGSFFPAWESLIAFLEEVRPSTTDEIGVGRLPDGAAFYGALLHYHTSTSLTAEEIHDIGWTQVGRIKEEMQELGAVFGDGDATVSELRQIAAETGGSLSGPAIVDEFQEIIAAADDEFRPYFRHEPSEHLEVVTDDGPVSFYVGPAGDGSRAGSFHAATGGGSIPVYTMRSLAYHEAVPGHHFQVALAQELDVPSPQRYWTNTGQVEGWALYAERLAFDIGLYDEDPVANFGRLDYELLRAARLVVDTGIHHLGWSREQAVATMSQIMDGPEYNGEIDRYVLYPGQATGYMVGLLAIIDLREASGVDVEDTEGLARFHDLIIGSGNVPLSVIQDASISAGS